MKKPISFLTFDQIVALAEKAEQESVERRQWGRWHLSVETLELAYVQDQRTFYRIDLERCSTSAEVLDWIFQLRGKSWTRVIDMGHLIDALHDILDPQANLCSWAITKKMDPKAYLRRRYGKGGKA